MPILKYRFPKGNVTISDTFLESTIFSAEGGVSAEIVSAKIGFDVTKSVTISVSWSGYYSDPVTIAVYPIYEHITGTLCEDTGQRVRRVGTFTIRKLIGTEI